MVIEAHHTGVLKLLLERDALQDTQELGSGEPEVQPNDTNPWRIQLNRNYVQRENGIPTVWGYI